MQRNSLRRAGWLAVCSLLMLQLPACGDDAAPADEKVTIGLVTNNPNGLRNVQGFRVGMTKQGYVEGEDVDYLFAGAPVSGDALDQELRNFVAVEVDLIFTAGTPTGVAAHDITAGTGIPVVFGVIADPIAAGVMEDLAAPGGNMTGVMLGQHQDRRLEILIEMMPGISRVFVPHNPEDSAGASAVAQVQAVADDLGVELVIGEARDEDEVAVLFDNLPSGIDAIFLVPDSTVNAHLPRIVEIAKELRLPISGPSTAQVEEGAVMTYGFIHEEAGAQAARIAAQVLRGADPATTPVEFTDSFLAVNLIAAETIGIEISDAVLRQAEVIVRAGDSGAATG